MEPVAWNGLMAPPPPLRASIDMNVTEAFSGARGIAV